MEVTVTEYRNGNERENQVRKIHGLTKYANVTLKRGIIGSLSLYSWLDHSTVSRWRSGSRPPVARCRIQNA